MVAVSARPPTPREPRRMVSATCSSSVRSTWPERGGRLGSGIDDTEATPVLALADGSMEAVAQVGDAAGAIEAMVGYLVTAAAGTPQRVGVGDATTPALADALAAALGARPEVVELVRYRIGPSVGAHTGPGTVGACFFPA